MKTLKELVEQYGERLEYKRKTHLTQYGEREKYLYFIHSGIVRMYTYDRLGNDCTFDFVFEGDFTNAFESFKFNKSSVVAIETLSDCVIYRFTKKAVENALSNGIDEVRIYIDVIENTFLRKLNREISLIRDTKYEQYCHLVENLPSLLLGYVPQKVIASYLGVCPHTISRYRNKVENRVA